MRRDSRASLSRLLKVADKQLKKKGKKLTKKGRDEIMALLESFNIDLWL